MTVSTMERIKEVRTVLDKLFDRTRRTPGVYPAIEVMTVIAPATARDKARPQFTAAWARHHYLEQLLREERE